MPKDTSIGISKETHQTLKAMTDDKNDLEDVIVNLLLLRRCPQCKNGDIRITKSYMFEPLYFDLKCDNCGYKEERWRVPFGVEENGK